MAREALQFTVVLPKGLRIPETEDNLSHIVESRYLQDGRTELTIEVADVTCVTWMKIIRTGGE